MSSTPVAAPEVVGDQVVLLAVTDPSRHPGPLIAALGTHHPGLRVLAVWTGDPQLRPCVKVPWVEPSGLAGSTWERDLVVMARPRSMWLALARTVTELLDAGAASVVAMEAGAIAVVGSLRSWLDPPAIARFALLVDQALPDDGCGPTDAELAAEGLISPSIAVFGPGARPLLAWLERCLRGRDELPVGQWLASAARLFAADCSADPRVGVGRWRWPDDADVALIDAPHFDAERPWVLDPHGQRPSRVDLIGHPARRQLMERAVNQLRGPAAPLRLPGGIAIDAAIRELVATSVDVPAPWSQPAAFRSWLEARYWFAVHSRRRDLAAAFPEPLVADRDRFDEWERSAFATDAVAALIRHRPAGTTRADVCRPLLHGGVNLVGYLGSESSLGDVARRLLGGLRESTVAVSTISYERTGSPRLAGAGPFDHHVRYDETIAVVNADQFPAMRMDHPEIFDAGARTIGYWFWELSTVSRRMLPALELVDEIWAGSRFVVDTFTAVADVPVRFVPIPVPAPRRSGLSRADFGRLAAFGDRFVFLVAFDHFSITERKNPIGAIRAFERAFAPGEGPVLVVKSMNAAQRWVHHQKVVAAAEGRPDIVFWDERLDRADQMALVAAADCLVSLHRSEGLGLHLAEAMWLGTPTIATRYSGNLDFMDDSCSMLVDASLVRVTDGQGVFPETAMWADPDLDQAAAAMRTMVADERRRQAIGAAALMRMRAQPTLAESGRHIAELLGIAQP